MNMTDYRQMIDDFENHYHYDSTYMRELLESSLEALPGLMIFYRLPGIRRSWAPRTIGWPNWRPCRLRIVASACSSLCEWRWRVVFPKPSLRLF